MATTAAIDPALLQRMNQALESGADSLRREAGALRADCEWWGIATGELREILAIAAWAEDQLPGLRRRQQLAAAMDARDGHIEGVLVPVPDTFLDVAAAAALGRQLAQQAAKELEDDGKLSDQTLAALQANGWDPALPAASTVRWGRPGWRGCRCRCTTPTSTSAIPRT
jgi:hypothetical protein